MRLNWSLNSYSCSPPGVGAVSDPSVLFFFELFLLEGLADVSAADSVLVDFSAPVAFFELLVLERDGLPVISVGDSVPIPCIDSLSVL